jgi:hypothetical protein
MRAQGDSLAAAGRPPVVQRASVVEIQQAFERFAVLRGTINGAIAAGEGKGVAAALLPALTQLLELARHVALDPDHEYHKSAYGGIYDFVDRLFERLDSVAVAPIVKDRLHELMGRIQHEMRQATGRAYEVRGAAEYARSDPVKYVAGLRKLDRAGDGLTRVIAQAAYMSGDMFGVAAALRLDPALGVAIFYDHLRNKDREIEDRLLEFYTSLAGEEHPRVALIPVTDSARAYKRAIDGDFSDGRLFPHGVPAIVSRAGTCSTIGTATRIVAESYTRDAKGSRAALEHEWLPEGAKEGTATGLSGDVSIAEWVRRKGLVRGQRYGFIWFRKSGAKGGAHKELDSSIPATEQIVAACKRGDAADRFVLMGDKEPELLRIPGIIDLTEFWNEKDSPFHESGRKMQLALFAYLVHADFNIMNIGMRSGALEGPALLGVPTVFLEERYNLQEGRMDQWQGAVPGFKRVELEHVPSAAGKRELRQVVDATLSGTHAQWTEAGERLRALTPALADGLIARVTKSAAQHISIADQQYQPVAVEEVLQQVLKSLQADRGQSVEALFGENKRPILAELRGAIRALQENLKGQVKRAIDKSYKGPDDGLSRADESKLDHAVSIGVGGWSEVGGSERKGTRTK